MPKRKPDHMAAQRERILRAAILCIADFGLEGTSIATIRNAAGLSTGAIYKHFSGKDEIIAEVLRFAAMTDAMLPESWPAFKASIASTEDDMGFEIATVLRARLQLFASTVRPGPLHDLLKPRVESALAMVAQRLAAMEASGAIELRMTPMQTAMCIAALADGLMQIGLASDRPLDSISGDIAAALECLLREPSAQPAA